MARYVAFLRGVSPTNASMPELKRCFEEAGFENVKTVLASGNVVFDSRVAKEPALERKIEAAMQKELGKAFATTVRSVGHLTQLLARDRFSAYTLPKEAKRVVTFFRQDPDVAVSLPLEKDGVQLLQIDGRELFTAYVPHPKGPVFMVMIEKLFGTGVTTRTWDTVKKCAAA